MTIDNGTLTDFAADSVALSDGSNVFTTELVTAVEGGAKTALAKAEGSVHASGDFGLQTLAVRKDTAVALDADGDYMPLIVDANGMLHVNVGAALAASRTTDSVGAALQTDAIMQGLTARTPAFAVIDAASSGDNTLLAAQGAGNMIRVHQVFLVAAGAVNVRFESGASGTALTGQMNLAVNSGFVLPFSPIGWFTTAANALLNLELSGAVSVDGSFAYTVVT